jgi:hypothetical protein
VRFARPIDPFVIDLVSFALFGSPADPELPPNDSIDLRGVLPLGSPLPRLLPAQDELRAIIARPVSVSPGRRAGGSVSLGQMRCGEQIRLSPRDRARHLYVLGATGTGKSTLLLNLIGQDLRAGEGVILIDPHGDLADAARLLVPERRRSEKATWNEISLENVAPYIVCKLSQITGNPLVRRMIEARRSTLDLRAVMDRGGVALVKLAKGLIGEYNAKLLATLLVIRIAQAAMARASLSPAARRPVRVYIDEFQNCAGGALGDMLAESRKSTEYPWRSPTSH